MTTQTLTIGKRRFVLVAESEFRKLQKRAASREVLPGFAKSAMRELSAYRRTGRAAKWSDVKRRRFAAQRQRCKGARFAPSHIYWV